MRGELFGHRPAISQTSEYKPPPLTATGHAGAILLNLARIEQTPASGDKLLDETVDHAIAVAKAPEKERAKAFTLLEQASKRDANTPDPTHYAERAVEMITAFMDRSKR